VGLIIFLFYNSANICGKWKNTLINNIVQVLLTQLIIIILSKLLGLDLKPGTLKLGAASADLELHEQRLPQSYRQLQQLPKRMQSTDDIYVFISFRSHNFSHLRIVAQGFCSTDIENLAGEKEANVSVAFIRSEKPFRTFRDHPSTEYGSSENTLANLCAPVLAMDI